MHTDAPQMMYKSCTPHVWRVAGLRIIAQARQEASCLRPKAGGGLGRPAEQGRCQACGGPGDHQRVCYRKRPRRLGAGVHHHRNRQRRGARARLFYLFVAAAWLVLDFCTAARCTALRNACNATRGTCCAHCYTSCYQTLDLRTKTLYVKSGASYAWSCTICLSAAPARHINNFCAGHVAAFSAEATAASHLEGSGASGVHAA